MQRSGHTAVLHWLCMQNNPSHIVDHCKEGTRRPKRWIFHYRDGEMTRSRDKTVPGNPLIFFSYEDQEPPIDNLEDVIVIIRDPLNWKASRYKTLISNRGVNHNTQRHPNENAIYLTHLKTEAYIIFFNQWFSSLVYRKQICRDLKLNFNDAGLQDVNQVSSWDSHHYAGKAQEMNVLYRWKQFKDNKKFMDQVTPEMIELYWRLRLYYDNKNHSLLPY